MTENLYQHFRAEEQSFINKIEGLCRQVETTYSYYLTEFLNPRQIEILRSIVRHRGLQCFVSSDNIPSEYARGIIAPDYYSLDFEDFNIVLMEILYNARFNQLTHSQIMGTLLNQLGIKREVFGDILVTERHAQLVLDKSMQTYFQTQVTKIANASVQLQPISLSDMIESEQEVQSVDIIVSSKRIDRIISTALHIPRKETLLLLEANKVKVNYQVWNKPSQLLSLGDLISVRGFGRFTIGRDNGLSKNGKHKLTIDKKIHK